MLKKNLKYGLRSSVMSEECRISVSALLLAAIYGTGKKNYLAALALSFLQMNSNTLDNLKSFMVPFEAFMSKNENYLLEVK